MSGVGSLWRSENKGWPTERQWCRGTRGQDAGLTLARRGARRGSNPQHPTTQPTALVCGLLASMGPASFLFAIRGRSAGNVRMGW